ncbi:MAG: hypothetical protein ACI9FN_003061, partial [Saprospiraceae bacterium]
AIFKTERLGIWTGFIKNSQPRDYGYYPKNINEYLGWNNAAIDLVVDIVDYHPKLKDQAIHEYSKSFRKLWRVPDLRFRLESTAIYLNTQSKLFELCKAANQILRYEKERLDPSAIDRASILAKNLAPVKLIDRARVYAANRTSDSMVLIDPSNKLGTPSDYKEVEKFVLNIGKELGDDLLVLDETLQDILLGASHQTRALGAGVALGSIQLLDTWEIIEKKTIECDRVEVDLNFSIGFLNKCYSIDKNCAHVILDSIIASELLNQRFFVYQGSIPIDQSSFSRIIRALEQKVGSPDQYRALMHVLCHHEVDENHCASILELMCDNEKGLIASVEILSFKLSIMGDHQITPGDSLKDIGIVILQKFPYTTKPIRDYDRELSRIYSSCLDDINSYNLTKYISQTILELSQTIWAPISDFKNLINAFAMKQPFAVLDGFIGNDRFNIGDLQYILHDDSINEDSKKLRWSVLKKIPDYSLLEWCNENISERCLILAKAIVPYIYDLQKEHFIWSNVGMELIRMWEHPLEILDLYYAGFNYHSWSGNLSRILEDRLPLLESLKVHPNDIIKEWTIPKIFEFKEVIEQHKISEKENNTGLYGEGSFE